MLEVNKYNTHSCMELINGKEVADSIKKSIAKDVETLKQNGRNAPKLVAVIVGDDPASQTYVGHKERACNEVGFKSEVIKLDETVTQSELIEVIQKLNNDPETDGFIVQLPLPKHLDEREVINSINPDKDVDGFHPLNIGKMMTGEDTFISATPFGIVELLEYYNIQTSGKHCVVVGRSNIVGRPVANLLSQKAERGDATVTMCHSRTKNMAELTRMADILIVAVGVHNIITEDMVKEGAVVIDVGMHRVKDDTRKLGYRLAGDVDFENVASKCSLITPVPGGVGPMTIISLMKNTLKAIKFRCEKEQ